MSGSPREEGGLPLAASLLKTDSSAATATGDTPEDQVSEHGLFSSFICLSVWDSSLLLLMPCPLFSNFWYSPYHWFLSAVVNHCIVFVCAAFTILKVA